MGKNRGRQTPALFGDGGPSATSSSDGVHRRLRESASARGMTVEIHENAGHGASGVGHDPSMSEMLAGLTMKEVFMLSMIFILFLKFTLVPWINVVGSEAWANAKLDDAGGSAGTPARVCPSHAASSTVSVVIFGAGGVGQELVMKLASSPHLSHGEDTGGVLEVVGLFDSSGGALAPFSGGGQMSSNALRNMIRAKRSGTRLVDMHSSNDSASIHQSIGNMSFYNTTKGGISHLISAFGPGGMMQGRPLIVVDATADSTEEHIASVHSLLTALPNSGLVLANKAPLCSSKVDGIAKLAFHALTSGQRGAAASKSLEADVFRRVRFEATVGAGLPVIRTLQDLLRAGDTIQRVEGIFSGTASFLLSEMRSGAVSSLDSALDNAIANGLTEPNPCVDLSGIDVSRKALIVARLIAMDVQAVTMEDVRTRPLAGCSFNGMRARVANDNGGGGDGYGDAPLLAAKNGGVVQYAATVDAGAPFSINVGSSEFSHSHPFSFGVFNEARRVHEAGARSSSSSGNGGSPDNVVLIQTLAYGSTPMVIRGPGAGRRVTALAVMSDLMQLAEDLLVSSRCVA